MRYLPLGGISWGTTKASEIYERLLALVEDEAPQVLTFDTDADTDADDFEKLEDLIEAILPLVPPYTYVGMHEGDGTDFGIWILWDEIYADVESGDLFLIDDPVDVPQKGFAIFFNDHGNVAFYENGELIWDTV